MGVVHHIEVGLVGVLRHLTHLGIDHIVQDVWLRSLVGLGKELFEGSRMLFLIVIELLQELMLESRNARVGSAVLGSL